MGEFLEYIKQLHYKLTGGPKKVKPQKPPGQRLDYDSVSDITDLSEEGILVTSMSKLPEEERKRLNRYMSQVRTAQAYEPPRHDCLKVKKKRQVDNSKTLVEMTLRSRVDAVQTCDRELSAHQFSARSVSMQADSVEKFEIDMQTELIDAKNADMQVDVYDLGLLRSKESQSGRGGKIGFRPTKTVGVNTEA